LFRYGYGGVSAYIYTITDREIGRWLRMPRPRLLRITELEELPQGLFGSARASALAAVDRPHNGSALIVAQQVTLLGELRARLPHA
jgi:hypothetical protein